MNKKIKLNYFVILILIVVIIPNSFGFGISPALTNLNFEPLREKTITLDIYNSEKQNLSLILIPTGEISHFIEIYDDEISFAEDEGKKSIKVKISLPKEMEKPGLTGGSIKFKEKNIDNNKDNINIQPKLAIKHEILVYVPYPGKYAEGRIKTSNIRQGEQIPVFITIMNLGEEDLENVYSIITLTDKEGTEYKKIKTESKKLNSKKVAEIITYIDSKDLRLDSKDLKPGDYIINASVYYENEVINLKTDLIIDDFLIELISIDVNNFKLGGIAKFEMLMRNIGNRLVNDVFAELLFKDGSGKIITNSKSFKIGINPDEVKETIAYWDTRDILPGDYNGTFTLLYEDKMLEKDIKTRIQEEKIEIDFLDITGFAVQEEKPVEFDAKVDIITSLLIIIIILLIIGIIVIIKKKK